MGETQVLKSSESYFGILLATYVHCNVFQVIWANTQHLTKISKLQIIILSLTLHFTSTEVADSLAGINIFKANNGNNKIMCEICIKLLKKTPERRHYC